MSGTASPLLSTLMAYITSSPSLLKFGPPAGSSSGIQLAASATVAASAPTGASFRNLDNRGPPAEERHCLLTASVLRLLAACVVAAGCLLALWPPPLALRARVSPGRRRRRSPGPRS